LRLVLTRTRESSTAVAHRSTLHLYVIRRTSAVAMLAIALAAGDALADCGRTQGIPQDIARIKDDDGSQQSLLRHAAMLIESGYAPYALDELESLAKADQHDRELTLRRQALVAMARSQVGESREARSLADETLRDARELPAPARAEVFPELASVYLREGLLDQGSDLMQRALDLSIEPEQKLRIAANLARVPASVGGAARRAEVVARLLKSLPQSDGNRQLRVIGWRAVVESGDAKAVDLPAISRLYTEASDGGDALGAADALGLLAGWHQQRGAMDAALAAADRAIALYAAAGSHPPVETLLARARALAASRDSRALSAYGGAVAAANEIRPTIEGSLLALGRTFRERYGEMYLEYADALLRSASSASAQDRTRILRSALDVIEVSKAAEVTDYFRDPCAAPEGQTTRPYSVDVSAAVVYPVILRDRTEILVSYRGGIEQFTARISREEITRIVNEYRELLEKRTTRQFLRPSRQLYDLLVRPMEPLLSREGIKLLAVVPDGALRTVPFAALYDGKHFLVERYATAVLPGLQMTDPRALNTGHITAIVEGLTVARHGFPALEAAAEEIDRVGRTFSVAPIRDEEFTRKRLEQELRETPAEVVHIASHGTFSRDPTKTFLLSYDGYVDLEMLRHAIGGAKVKDEPLELLTLSACETAAGDERAALGLAGIALRAGARSALASLWSVNDESTAVLAQEFYQELAINHRSRAESLRLAQLKLLHDERYSHPVHWAAFLMIGSWL